MTKCCTRGWTDSRPLMTLPLKILENVFGESGFWIIIACWVVLCSRHVDALDDAVVDEHGEALAARSAKH